MSRERILVFGPQGSGKSYNLLKIAKWLKPKGAHFWVLDTDDAYPRMLEDPEFQGLDVVDGGNVHVSFGFGWEDYVNWLDAMEKAVTPGRDWVVVDRADKAWDRVQHFVSEEVYEQPLAERLLERKKQMKKKAMVVSVGDQADWQVINASYQGWFLRMMYRLRCHVYLTAAVRPVRSEDDQHVQAAYGYLGLRPEGQKSLGYEPDTVLFLARTREGWTATTVKDRGGREYFSGSPLISLAQQYLMVNGYA